jgi:hypothetical protein
LIFFFQISFFFLFFFPHKCISVEGFPTYLRASAIGILSACGRIAAVIAQIINGDLISKGIFLLLLISCIFIGIGALSTFFLPSETSKTDIEDD